MSPDTPVHDKDTTVSDRVLAVVMTLFAVGAIWFSRDISAMARVFPQTIAIVLLLLSLILLVKAFITRSRAEAHEPGHVARRFWLVGIILAWAFSLNWLGFLASSMLGTVALTVVAHFHDWNAKRALIYGASLMLIIGFFYGLFAILLDVPLPSGVLWRNL